MSPAGHRHRIQARFKRSRLRSLPSTCSIVVPGLSPAATCRARLGSQRIPALGFAARLAILLRHRIVGMHLHAQLFSRKDHLDQQRRVCRRRAGAEQRLMLLGKSAASGLPACGPVATRQSSPVSQTSPIGSPSATRSYQGRRSRNPHTRAVNRGSMRKGASSSHCNRSLNVVRCPHSLHTTLQTR